MTAQCNAQLASINWDRSDDSPQKTQSYRLLQMWIPIRAKLKNDMKRNRSHAEGVVADGNHRVRQAIEPQIRAAVEAEYAERWQAASLWRRFWLRREMNREVERRLELAAPSHAVY
jgi:hypothetical protein